MSSSPLKAREAGVKTSELIMGASESKEKMYCTRYLNGKGPPPLTETDDPESNNPKKNSLIKQGNQPDGGQMNWKIERRSLPGHSDCDTIQILFQFDDGIQSDKHPHPGHSYYGTECVAYLPQNTTGTKILRLLEQAFEHKLLFTVEANSSGEYCVKPADIPLKTLDSGGPGSSGYPDPTYLKTVKNSLKVKGIK
ncbi:E3 ubiquitin-protein ligase DTX3L-like isoform X1 [Carassius carassius]|uniref:E3 ubiquitin-protein ligase DTX3L-like isoform X1 n=2 Tax=Carassius carassius TaxID=217509 RepID=UPI002868BC6F|nr:E3 ubiquitin-protein ligase DTX3L-like isoform X1 [Carassius carassius]